MLCLFIRHVNLRLTLHILRGELTRLKKKKRINGKRQFQRFTQLQMSMSTVYSQWIQGVVYRVLWRHKRISPKHYGEDRRVHTVSRTGSRQIYLFWLSQCFGIKATITVADVQCSWSTRNEVETGQVPRRREAGDWSRCTDRTRFGCRLPKIRLHQCKSWLGKTRHFLGHSCSVRTGLVDVQVGYVFLL